MVTQTLDKRTLDKHETFNLIASDKVEGTNVYRSNGDKIGSIERLMLDKLSGKVAYAVMSFGGFLGIGQKDVAIAPDSFQMVPASASRSSGSGSSIELTR